MTYNFLTPLAEMRHAARTRYGSFAVAPIAQGTIVVTFGGMEMPRQRFDTFPAPRRSRSIQVETNSFLLGPEVLEQGDAVNHSCAPNCGMGGATQVVAMLDITIGAELTFDYVMSDASDYDEFACECGTLNCRAKVTANDWQLIDLQNRYKGYFSPYIVRKIRARQLRHVLSKKDVEALFDSYDKAPRASLEKALRVVTGYHTSPFETLIAICDFTKMHALGLPAHVTTRELSKGGTAALDALATFLTETRDAPLL